METLSIYYKTTIHRLRRKYKMVPAGKDLPIAYDVATPDKLISVLEMLRKNGTRIKIYEGNKTSGKGWNEEYGTTGTIGLTKGYEAYFPILLANTRSKGGSAISSKNILKISSSTDRSKVYYCVDNYVQSTFEIKPEERWEGDYKFAVYMDGHLYSRHTTEQSAKRLVAKLK